MVAAFVTLCVVATVEAIFVYHLIKLAISQEKAIGHHDSYVTELQCRIKELENPVFQFNRIPEELILDHIRRRYGTNYAKLREADPGARTQAIVDIQMANGAQKAEG
jgi:hypothetical protein